MSTNSPKETTKLVMKLKVLLAFQEKMQYEKSILKGLYCTGKSASEFLRRNKPEKIEQITENILSNS
jgi:hypothetical protein